jgi:hypothetical protein
MAYAWNTDTNSLQPEEVILFIIIIGLGIFLFVLLTLLLTTSYRPLSKMLNYSFAVVITYLVVEGSYHFIFRKSYLERALYSNIQLALECATSVVGLFGVMYGLAIAWYYDKHLAWCLNSCSIYILVICFAAYSLPVLIEAFIYPTEIISTIGFIMIAIATVSAVITILKRFIKYGSNNKATTSHNDTRSGSNNKSTSTMTKIWICLNMGLAIGLSGLFFIWLILSCTTVWGLFILYLLLLKLLLESPTSQLIQLILTLVPVIVGICSLVIQIKLRSEKKANQPKENTDSEINSDNSDDERVSEEDDQTQDSTSTREQNQPESGQLRKRVRVATQLRETQQTPQESSQEIQVQIEVEPNQDDNTDSTTEDESIM